MRFLKKNTHTHKNKSPNSFKLRKLFIHRVMTPFFFLSNGNDLLNILMGLIYFGLFFGALLMEFSESRLNRSSCTIFLCALGSLENKNDFLL